MYADHLIEIERLFLKKHHLKNIRPYEENNPIYILSWDYYNLYFVPNDSLKCNVKLWFNVLT